MYLINPILDMCILVPVAIVCTLLVPSVTQCILILRKIMGTEGWDEEIFEETSSCLLTQEHSVTIFFI